MPNRYFGFRNGDTFASVEAWNAAQLAGFSWALFGGGCALAIGVVVLSVAYFRHWTPIVHIVIATIAPLVLLGALGAAHYHANAAASNAVRHIVVDNRPVI
ncbi:SdpI family protein [Mycobacteroides chelonae]|uniref:SdpI family protein n=1 Tax=Mycobacteroides chelonae TaxID=1774 RepID=UPI000D699E7F